MRLHRFLKMTPLPHQQQLDNMPHLCASTGFSRWPPLPYQLLKGLGFRSFKKEWYKRFALLKERSALSLSNKWAILTKNQRAKSQPCSLITCLTCAPLLASQDDPPSPPVGACPRRRWRGIGPPDHPFCRSTKRRQDPRFATKERILALQNRTVIFGE